MLGGFSVLGLEYIHSLWEEMAVSVISLSFEGWRSSVYCFNLLNQEMGLKFKSSVTEEAFAGCHSHLHI